MSTLPFRPSPADLLRARSLKARKVAIASVVERYRKLPSETPAELLTEPEVLILKAMLGVSDDKRITRNGYTALRGGHAHRNFDRLAVRGLVKITGEERDSVHAVVTPEGIRALEASLNGKAA